MGSMHRRLGGSAISTTTLRDVWRSPRGEVLRIEALALVAIALSFLVLVFGSCRRWSNHWIVQKGFLAAQVVSLSLGTYSIGQMQSSPIKSEMYPIWAVSVLTIFGGIDPVTTYIGLDYKSPLLKMVFQLCLYYGYVLLMSISTMSSGIVKVAIYVLSAITFVKGFHRSLPFVHQRTTRLSIGNMSLYPEPADLAGGGDKSLKLHLAGYLPVGDFSKSLDSVEEITMADIRKLQCKDQHTTNGMTIEDVCLGYSLSHLLQRSFLGFTTSMEMQRKREQFDRLVQDGGHLGTIIDYKRTLKVVEVELAFLYEVYFSSNEFLHFYQAKTASFWALVSFIAICFLGAAAAVIIPTGAGMASGHSNTSSATAPAAGAGTTLVILVSLSLLQLVQLIRCWTSNWAIVSFACEVASKQGNPSQLSWMMVLRKFLVTRMNNWFDNKYLWQDKLGQYSIVDGVDVRVQSSVSWIWISLIWFGKFGVHYVMIGLKELLGSNTTNTEASFRLHEDDDVKASIAEFLGQIKSTRIDKAWASLFVQNGLEGILEDLPYSTTALPLQLELELKDSMTITTPMASDAYAFTYRVMLWHIVTCKCELVEQEQAAAAGGSSSSRENDKNRRVATALSKYCAYLVVSAPELLRGPVSETKCAFRHSIERSKQRGNDNKVEKLVKRLLLLNETTTTTTTRPSSSTDHWKVLKRVWVQTLLYAAPYGDVQVHMQHLSQGGEFITHLWALLYHLVIDSW